MMTLRTKQKIDETLRMLCVDLGIPYDPYTSDTDPRAMLIANALVWMANDVERQCKENAPTRQVMEEGILGDSGSKMGVS